MMRSAARGARRTSGAKVAPSKRTVETPAGGRGPAGSPGFLRDVDAEAGGEGGDGGAEAREAGGAEAKEVSAKELEDAAAAEAEDDAAELDAVTAAGPQRTPPFRPT